MKTNLFYKNSEHKDNLELNIKDLIIFNQEIYNLLNLSLGKNLNTIDNIELKDYTNFKSIRLEQINVLRKNIFKLNVEEKNWCQRILRFLEYRFSTLAVRFKANYANKNERVIFIQNLISFLLEYSYISKDARFLSLAIKLQRINRFTNNKVSAQASYNLLLSKYLIDNFNK